MIWDDGTIITLALEQAISVVPDVIPAEHGIFDPRPVRA